MRRLLFCFALCLGIAAHAAAQPTSATREKSRQLNKAGWDYMKAEQFENAVKAFQQSVEVDPSFDMPWYGLGRGHMALKQYVSAISALNRCADIYRAETGRQFTNRQEAQRYRQDRLTELDEMIRQAQSGPQTMARQDQIRQLQEQRRQLQDIMTRGNDMSVTVSVPAWVSLSLGSAYFRSGKLKEAEIAYKDTVSADPKSGEALSNLAVVYLETERPALALTTLEAAKKTGFKVNPELEKAIRERAK